MQIHTFLYRAGNEVAGTGGKCERRGGTGWKISSEVVVGKDTFEQNAGGHGPLLTCTPLAIYSNEFQHEGYFLSFFTYVPNWSFCSYQ